MRILVIALFSIPCFFTGINSSSALDETGNSSTISHPRLLVTTKNIKGLRQLDDVRDSIKSGRSKLLWEKVVVKADREKNTPPIEAGERNRSYGLVADACNRITDAALVAMIKNDRSYAISALKQIEVLFDQTKWPDWSDRAHLNAGLIADLRHGQFACAIGFAYDWAYHLFTPEERQRILKGLDHCAISRYKKAVDLNEKWVHRQNNWKTCIVGGFGILGMALEGDHPDAVWLQEFGRPLMIKYLEIFGPEGEFNESPPYAGSMVNVITYFLADYYSSDGKRNIFREHNLTDFCRWYMYSTSPPGRIVSFGDGKAGSSAFIFHFSAIAAALQDPVIQWFYLQYSDLASSLYQRPAFELLFYNPQLKPEPPDDKLPLARAYHAQSRLISSRSSWDPLSTASLVHAKAGKEDYHCHADWGQICIDGFGERLIVDLGSPPVYPRTDKRMYYNYQQLGHNTFVIGDDDLGITWRNKNQGTIHWSESDDTKGAAWTMDLSPVYGEGKSVRRHIIHLYPNIVAVLDEVNLPQPEKVRLRWHSITPAELDKNGEFTVSGKKACLTGFISPLSGNTQITQDKHQYLPPYDKGRYDNPYPQRNEPYIQIQSGDKQFRVLTLFGTFESKEKLKHWKKNSGSWELQTEEGPVVIQLDQKEFIARNNRTGKGLKIDLNNR